MISKLELYAIGLGVLLLIVAGAYFKGRHDQHGSDETKAEAAMAQANAKADALQEKLDAAGRVSAEKFEEERNRHDQELLAARSAVTDRLCGRASHSEVPTAVTTPAGTTAAAASPAVSERDSGDEWRFAFVQACQHDSDALAGWQSWWASQRIAE